jgi:hypothetical protein
VILAARRNVRAVLALAAALAVVGCSSSSAPTFFAEQPVGSNAWTPIDGEPAWVATPPHRDGMLVHVMTAKSDFRSLAGTPSGVANEVGRRVAALLTPVTGADDAARAADAAAKAVQVVGHACREEDGPHPEAIGNHIVTAWWLAEVPVGPVIATLPEAKRDAARAALR